jgi:hypothetical protein
MPGPGWTIGVGADGRHCYVPPQPQPPVVVVQAPAPVQRGEYFPPWLVQFLILLVAILGAVIVLTGTACAVVVLMGGTLIGIIGAVRDALPFLAFLLIGTIVAAGWAASKVRPLVRGKKRDEK